MLPISSFFCQIYNCCLAFYLQTIFTCVFRQLFSFELFFLFCCPSHLTQYHKDTIWWLKDSGSFTTLTEVFQMVKRVNMSVSSRRAYFRVAGFGFRSGKAFKHTYTVRSLALRCANSSQKKMLWSLVFSYCSMREIKWVILFNMFIKSQRRSLFSTDRFVTCELIG